MPFLVVCSAPIRKTRSAIINALGVLRAVGFHVRAFWDPAVRIGTKCRFAEGVILRATDGGSIELGARVSLASNVQIVAQHGKVVIGDDVHIGVGSIIVCREGVTIGADTLIAEYVVIRDQDHETARRPIRSSGFSTGPIQIGRDVWLGAKATVLRGVTVGEGSVIGAHALVNTNIPPNMIAVGIPARVVRSRETAS